MATTNETISDKRKNSCAVALMRRMLVKYSQKSAIPFDDALLLFTGSPVYDDLFDYDTEIWKEGPDYLMQLFEETLQELH